MSFVTLPLHSGGGSFKQKVVCSNVCWNVPGIRAARGVKPINHALFADDSLLLGGASLNIARSFNGILQNLCSISGDLINKEKSVVYVWNVDHTKMLQISNTLGFSGFAQWVKINI